MPRVVKQDSHVEGFPVNQPRSLGSDATVEDLSEEIVVVERDQALDIKDQVEALKFAEERVLIILDRPREKFPPKMVDVYIQGKPYWIPVGIEVDVPRKVIEVLARAVSFDVQTEIKNEQAQYPDNLIHRFPNTRYPFTVLRDTDKGVAWLAKLRREVA